jgi:hypothetical protein
MSARCCFLIKNSLVLLATVLFVAVTVRMNLATGATSSKSELNLRRAEPADPHKVVTMHACIKCHPAEIEVWKKTPHSQTFEQLHRLPEAKEIASKLGIRSIKYDNRCVACHYTQKIDQGRPVAIAGISCESCHGAASPWVDIHHDYGGQGITRETESHQHREMRIASAIQAGMRNPNNVYLVAQSC